MPESADPPPGALWAILRRGKDRLTLHLVDLTDQTEIGSNRGKHPLTPCADVTVRIALPADPVAVTFTAPAASCRSEALASRREGNDVVVEVPSFTGWAVISFDLRGHQDGR